MNEQSQPEVLKTAHTAFQHFKNGWASGDFFAFLAMLTDDFEFAFPTGKQRGIFDGKTGHAKMLAKCREDFESGNRLTLHEPRTVAVDRQTVIFEFSSEGDFGEFKYHGRNIIVLAVEGEKICAFREYFGDLDPQLFGQNSE